MSAQTFRKALLPALAIALICAASNTHAALEMMGGYNITNIKNVYLEDLSGEKTLDVVVATTDGVYALTNKARLKWFYEAPNLRSVVVSDINNDGFKEIVISTGVSVNAIERGNLYILDRNGKVIDKHEQQTGESSPYLIYNVMKAIDLDDNGYEEIIGGTSIGVYALSDSYDRIIWGYRTDESMTGVFADDASIDSSKDIIANSFTNIYTLTSDGRLRQNYSVREGIKRIITGEITGKYERETLIISDEDNIYLLDKNYRKKAETNLVSNIIEAEAFDLTGDGFEELVLGTKNGVYVVNSRFLIKNRYVTNDEVHGLYFSDWDADGSKEIVFGSGEYIHILAADGKEKDKLYVGKHVDGFVNGDLDNDGYTEAVITSGKSVYILKNKASKSRNEARQEYVLAASYVEMGRYDEAEKYLVEAVRLYKEAGDAENLKVCDDLKKEIDSRVIRDRQKEADGLYEAAGRYLESSDLEKARESLDKAKKIYSETNDTEGLARCDTLSAKIPVHPQESENPPALNISSVFNKSSDVGLFPMLSIFLIVAVVLLVVVLMIRRK